MSKAPCYEESAGDNCSCKEILGMSKSEMGENNHWESLQDIYGKTVFPQPVKGLIPEFKMSAEQGNS